jgi:hypothetical protein
MANKNSEYIGHALTHCNKKWAKARNMYVDIHARNIVLPTAHEASYPGMKLPAQV